ALRKTQLEMLRGEAGENYSHPYYWASFIPSGNWQPIPPRFNRTYVVPLYVLSTLVIISIILLQLVLLRKSCFRLK
ncbi:MAG: CHAT domain-containing protein, partial [Trichodesmium sp. MAG_R04]|nr:CHAT domain-containing protein [Trichodesmium sp. MAG_R04]